MNGLMLLALGLPLAFAVAGLRRVPPQRSLTVRRFGRYRRTLAPGWHWLVPGLDRSGAGVDLMGHHVSLQASGEQGAAELYYQILEPEKAGATLDSVDDWVASQAREAMGGALQSPEQFKHELNRRVGQLGLRVIRCSLHVG
jgi:regulator of protease activity HflC (stomatin/prohibitin superfamily)